MDASDNSQRTTFAVLGSSLLHAGLVVAVLTLQIQPHLKNEIVEIQFNDNSPAPAAALPLETPVPQETQVPVVAPEPKLPAKTAVAALPAKTVVAAQTEAAPESAAAVVPVQDEAEEPAFNERDLDETFAHVDSETAAQSPVETADMFNDDSDVLAAQAKNDERERAESAAKMSALRQAQSRAELARVREARQKAHDEASASAAQAANENRKQKAQEKAAEVAAAEARYQAAQQAAAQAAAQAAEADRLAVAQTAAAAANARQGELQGSKGSAGESPQASTVRPLEDLKQMPGNDRPLYDEDDRLSGRSGLVVFYAFITSAGHPSEFKLIQSSGHKSLDLKTLKAIRGWKFYPGQEGWVEIPFQWDLKGEPKAIGGTLRKVSQK